MPNLLDAPDLLDSQIPLDGGTGVLHFVPPVMFDEGPINPDSEGNQRRLFGYYQPHARGVNVWKLADGSYSQEQPYPLVTPDDVRQGVATVATYLSVYYGGHIYEVTETEADALRAAGYSENVS